MLVKRVLPRGLCALLGAGVLSSLPVATADPAGWRSSTDLAWTTDGDSSGFHVLVAEARTGYTWRTAASHAGIPVSCSDPRDEFEPENIRSAGNADYARAWIHAKHIYHLSITAAEYGTLAEILNTRC